MCPRMARPTNRQSRSVGNLGDILKHAALVELASMLAARGAPVSYVDTHCFLLHAPLADPERWHREIEAHVERHPAYERYAARERASIARTGDYRCSSGLVIDTLEDARGSTVLGEANAATRTDLRAQIADEHLTNVFVVDDAVEIDTTARVPRGGVLLVHVDPFSLTPALWATLRASLDAMSGRSSESIFVLYRYSRSARSAWPAAPAGTLGPVAEIRGGPHEIAVYASAVLTDVVREICDALGFRQSP